MILRTEHGRVPCLEGTAAGKINFMLESTYFYTVNSVIEMESKTHTYVNLEFLHALMHTRWGRVGNSSVVSPKLMFQEKHR